jgi:hypothetical protein
MRTRSALAGSGLWAKARAHISATSFLDQGSTPKVAEAIISFLGSSADRWVMLRPPLDEREQAPEKAAPFAFPFLGRE